jgi:hypothetical protein
MKPNALCTSIAFVFVCFSLAACGQQGETVAQQKASSTAGSTRAAQVLAYAPADTKFVQFADWALLKQSLGTPTLTGKSSQDDLRQFLSQINQHKWGDLPGIGGLGIGFRLEEWSWDVWDLDWYAGIQGNGPVVGVYKFRSDFDLAPVRALYSERGFSTQAYEGVSIYSHDMTDEAIAADWGRQDLGVFNTAVLPDENILILSPKSEPLRAVIDTYRNKAGKASLAESLAVRLDSVGPLLSFSLHNGDAACPTVPADHNPILDRGYFVAGRGGEIIKQTHSYDTLIVGYRPADKGPQDLFIMHYADAALAQADLETRRASAENDASIAMNKGSAYHDWLFTVDDASVEGTDLVIRASPINSNVSGIFSGLEQRDLVFTVCP